MYSLIALALLALVLTQVAQADVPGCALNVNRLAHFYRPEHYDLTLEPDLEQLHFHGKVDILLKYTGESGESKWRTTSKIARTTSKARGLGSSWGRTCLNVLTCGGPSDSNYRKIVLNVGPSLDIDGAKLVSLGEDGQPDGLGFEIDDICRDNNSQVLVITVNGRLKRSTKAKLELTFRGPLTSRFAGPLVGSADQKRLTSDLFPGRARFAFPSFDQPDLRATFALTLLHHWSLESISNTPMVSEVIANEKKTVKFGPTRPIPTFGLAFAIAPKFNTISCRAEGQTKPLVTAYVPQGRPAQDAQFILELVCASIPSIERYLRVPFPLYKLSLTTSASRPISGQSKRTTVTNSVGMLIFDENYLLFNATDNELADDQQALAAQLALQGVLSQWIGSGLVTSDWWDDYWLVEGFVRWRSRVMANEQRPEFDLGTNLLLGQQARTLDAMARANTNLLTIKQAPKSLPQLSSFPNDAPRSVAVETSRLQQSQAYEKASSLFFMLGNTVGEILIRDIWAQIVVQNEWGSTNLDQFMKEAESITGSKSLEAIINSYIYTKGVPLVSVRRADKGSVELSQERVILGSKPGDPVSVKTDELMTVPISLIVSDGADRQETIQATLSARSIKIQLPIWFDTFNQTHWLKLNQGFNGLYRSYHDMDLLKKLRSPIVQKKMSVSDRINIVDDAKALLEMGKTSLRDLESLINWFTGETDGEVLSALYNSILPLLSARKSDLGEPLDEIVNRLFEPIYQDQGFKINNNGEEQNNLAKLNGRRDALTALIQFGNHKAATEEAACLFESTEPETGEKLERFLWRPVFSAVIKRGSHEHQFEQLLRRLRLVNSIYEREKLVNHLVSLISDEEDERRARLLTTL